MACRSVTTKLVVGSPFGMEKSSEKFTGEFFGIAEA